MHSSKWMAGLMLALTLAATARAQEVSIAEYSAAQRVAIEEEISKARAKAFPAPQAPSAPAVALRRFEAPVEPSITVAGVAIISNRAVAEIAVNGISYMLEVGETVPGTKLVLTYADDKKVQLTKSGAKSPASKAAATIKTIELRGGSR
jgi:hypothetical protein